MKKTLLTIILAVLALFSIACSSGGTGSPEQIEPIEPIVDVNQFSRISTDELMDIMGEPEDTEVWSNETSKGTFEITIYYYDASGYEFLLADNSVVRMNIHSPHYYDQDAESFGFTTEASVLDMLGIDSDDDRIKKTADTGYALRFSPVSDTVADVWCSVMEKEEQTIDEIKVTFNANYFE